MKEKFTLQDLLDDFYENFSSKEDYSPDEAEVWLGVEIKRLFEENIPKKISDNAIEKEIRDFPRRLDDEGKQKIRAKNYGWNLCVVHLTQLLTK